MFLHEPHEALEIERLRKAPDGGTGAGLGETDMQHLIEWLVS